MYECENECDSVLLFVTMYPGSQLDKCLVHFSGCQLHYKLYLLLYNVYIEMEK